MKSIIKNRKASWIIRVIFIFLILIMTHATCYYLGKSQAQLKSDIFHATDNYNSYLGALQFDGSEEQKKNYLQLLEHESIKVAEISIEYPRLADPMHYLVLVDAKNNLKTIDPRINKALLLLEEAHKNDWEALISDRNKPK